MKRIELFAKNFGDAFEFLFKLKEQITPSSMMIKDNCILFKTVDNDFFKITILPLANVSYTRR